MAIDKSAALEDYKRGTAGAASKLVRNYTKKTGKVDAAASDEAQSLYEEAMADPAVLQRRQNNLRKLSDADLNKAMEQKGGAAYTQGTKAGADKFSRNVAPFLDEIDSIVAGLPARTRDPEANVIARVVPLAVGLAQKKKDLE